MNVFEKLYKELKRKYGTSKGQWKLWCRRPKTKREREKVVDEYTRRLVKKQGLADRTNYQFLGKLFEENLKRDYCLYQDFHALIVINGKNRVAKIVQ